MTAWSFERVAGPFETAAGGVVWDGAAVLFSLPSASTIMRFDPVAGSVDTHRKYTSGIDGLSFGPDGVLYACQSVSRRVVRLHANGSTSALPYRLDGRVHNTPRDLDVDSDGRIWFTDPHTELRPPGPQVFPLLDHASVLRLDHVAGRPWQLRRMTFDTTAPAAVLVSPDGRTLYVSEHEASPSGRRELRAYPIEGDELGPYTTMHTFGSDARSAHRGVQGLCFDAEGNIVACAGGSNAGPGPMIYVFDPSGRVLTAEPAPSDPVGCAFGDADLTTLYVTTSTGELHRVRGAGRKASEAPS